MNEEAQCRNRFHVKGKGQENCHTGGCGQSGQRTDDNAEKGTEGDHSDTIERCDLRKACGNICKTKAHKSIPLDHFKNK